MNRAGIRGNAERLLGSSSVKQLKLRCKTEGSLR